MQKKVKVAILIILVLILAFTFYPRKRVENELRGFIAPNATTIRAEYSCFGVSYDFCPEWPDYGCDFLCYGITYGKKCFNETATSSGTQKVPIECNRPEIN